MAILLHRPQLAGAGALQSNSGGSLAILCSGLLIAAILLLGLASLDSTDALTCSHVTAIGRLW